MVRSTTEVLLSVRRVLENALQGEADFREGGERRISGLYNAVSSGRSVTFVLQNLRSGTDGFDAWYAPVQEQLKADSVSKYFVDLRNRIEKEGDHGASSSIVTLRHLDQDDLMRNAPPDAVSAFIGDELGRSGWIVRLPDGTETTFYFTLPADVAEITLSLTDAPSGRDVADLLREWLDRLESIYRSAVERFAIGNLDLIKVGRPKPPAPSGMSDPLDDTAVTLIRQALRDAGYGE